MISVSLIALCVGLWVGSPDPGDKLIWMVLCNILLLPISIIKQCLLTLDIF